MSLWLEYLWPIMQLWYSSDVSTYKENIFRPHTSKLPARNNLILVGGVRRGGWRRAGHGRAGSRRSALLGRRRQETAGDSSGAVGREGAAGAPPHLTRATTTDTHTGSGPCDTGDDNTGQWWQTHTRTRDDERSLGERQTQLYSKLQIKVK